MRKMKDSGVEWIGEIPEEWEVTTYRRLLKRRKEYDNNSEKQILSLTINGVKKKAINDNYGKMAENYTDHQIVKKDDLVFTPRDFDATPILSGNAPCDGCISNLYFILYARSENVFLPFYNYFMWGVKWGGDIWRKLSYGMRFSYNYSQFSSLPVVRPSIKEQKHIAEFLDRKCAQIDAIITKQQEIIEKLKLYKQSVITEAVTKGLDPDVPMKDSGIEWIGEIPVHWLAPKIKYMASVTSGGTPDRNRPEYWNGNINWLKTGELKNAEIYGSEEKITEEGLANSSAKIFSENTILMAMYGQGKTRGTTALLKVPCSTNQACAGIRLVNKAFSTGYLWKCLIGAYDSIRGKAEGSGQPNLSGDLISDFNLPMPPLKEQKDICTYIDCKCSYIDSLVLKKQTLIDKLTQYKKSLIYEAVTGKLEV